MGAQIKMNICKNHLNIIAIIGIIFTKLVGGSPIIKTIINHKADLCLLHNNDINIAQNETPFTSCYESIPCGWALYSTEMRKPFRRISSYTRNKLCVCDPDHKCVLTDNLQDRRSYVFHCRHRESSLKMFPFPHRK